MIDHYEDELGTYLMKLSGKPLSDEDNHTVSNLFHCMGDFERISDHALNLAETQLEMQAKEENFLRKSKRRVSDLRRSSKRDHGFIRRSI